MADDVRNRVDLLREIKELEQNIESINRSINSGASGLNEYLREQKELLVDAGKELKKVNQERLKGLKDQEESNSSLSSMYSSLNKLEQERILLTLKSDSLTDAQEESVKRLAEINREMAQLSISDVAAKVALNEEYKDIVDSFGDVDSVGQQILNNLTAQNQQAQSYSNMTVGQKEQLQSQLEAYDGIKKSVSGILDTLSIITSGPMGALGMGLIGAGYAAESVGKNIRSFGGFVDSAQLSTLGLGFAFEDAEDVAKGLSKEMGGLKDVTFATQLNTNLMAINMGISGDEAATVVGSFARLNGMSASTAADMAATTKEMAKAAGVPVDQVMKDVAGSAEAFAEYGKDGGINIAKAAVSAGKLGVSMNSLTKVTDSLLDFETSINQELELGAMLGKNLQLDRARALAYEGNIGGAVKETLQQLGGIEAFNKMDIFQKRKAAELLGLSVDEFQKMAANSEKLNDDGTIQLSKFESMKEALTGIVTGPLGGMLKGLGSGVLAVGQMAGGFSAMGVDVKSLAQKVPLLNKLPGLRGGAGATPSAAPAPTGGAPGADKAGAFGKMNTTALLKGAAALLILGAALYVFAKAANAFGDDVNWANVFIGIGAMTLLGGVAAILGTVGPMILVGAAALLVASAAFYVFGLASQEVAKGMAMMGEALPVFAAGMAAFVDAPYIQFGIGITGLAVSMIALGATSPFMLLAAAGLSAVGAALNMVAPNIPLITEQMAALSQISFMPILGLATSLMTLSAALAAVALTGLMALPVLLALGGLSTLFGGGEGGGAEAEDAKMDELINEIKALRGDLLAGKIAVNMDGQKVTSKVSSIVDRVASNSYAKV